MKKLLLLIVFVVAALAANAQSASFGIRGGASFANLAASFDGSNVSASTGNLVTFNAGLFADFKLGRVSIQPALSYAGKGGEQNNGGGEYVRVRLHYLQLPVNVVYHAPVMVGNIYIGAGPYAALGLSGHGKGNSGGTAVDADVKFGNDSDSDFRREEFGMDFVGGLEFKSGFLIHINYDLGLSNILPSTAADQGFAFRNRVFGAGIGFKF